MSRLDFLDTHARTRAVQALKGVPAFARNRLTAADVWVQDHHAGLGGTVLTVLCTATLLPLHFRMDQVIELARQFAPVFTIISITMGAVFTSIKWVRKRREARLAARS
ncbi:hypothetical protein [Streptomyces sp. NBC_01104]|uniref:hypothetical protein n=1 Tax=Streptomyces sp. NBC_01104 TaxID=2903750 RepID=UPI0038633C21|nr:hypothetical protein OG450_00130 [Streptomyces sp. NBC_01104]